MGRSQFKKEDYILYILNRLEPGRSDFWYLNKIAFLVEFAFIYNKEAELSNIRYAAIDHGPVIDQYKTLLEKMEEKDLVKLDGFKIRLVDSRNVGIPKEVSDFIDPLIKKYSQMTRGELRALTHSTDSYKITTDNEKVMGKIIKKDLANLETFYDEDATEETGNLTLPKVNFERLSKYEF